MSFKMLNCAIDTAKKGFNTKWVIMTKLIEHMRHLLSKIRHITEMVHFCSVSSQKKYINKLPEPLNDLERSFLQYKCQKRIMGAFAWGLLSLASFPLIAYFYLIGRCSKKEASSTSVDAVFISNSLGTVYIPDSLKNEFDRIISIENEQIGMRCDAQGRAIIKKMIKEHPFSWYFHLKAVLKLGAYGSVIEKYNPQVIIASVEYSFTSSLLTNYCEAKAIRHINITHGEHVYDIGRAFCRFHRFYIWDNYYKDLFVKLRADENQFITEKAEAYKFANRQHIRKTRDYVYYLGDETSKQVKSVAKSVKQLQTLGNIVAVRPHPRYNKLDTPKNRMLFSGIEIEDVNNRRIEDSILESKNVIAQFSMVLNQAYENGVNVVIDDITNRRKFNDLQDAGYIMLEKPHTLLSDILRQKQERINI